MKKTVFLPVLFFLLLDISIPGSAQTAVFNKVFYDLQARVQAYGISRSADSAYIIAGLKDDYPLALKMDANGNILWSKQYTAGFGSMYCVTSTSDQNILLAGYIYNSLADADDILLIKITPEGDIIWSETIDMGYSDHPYSLRQTTDNGFIITGGSSSGAAPPYYRALVIKLDADGNLVWGRMFHSGNMGNYAYAAAEAPDGGFVVTGCIGGSGATWVSNLVLFKLDQNGNLLWSKKEDTPAQQMACGTDVVILPDGMMCYKTTSSYEAFLLKTDLFGNTLWCKSLFINGNFPNDMPGPKLHKKPGGNFVFVNSSNQFAPLGQVVETDSAGEILWGRDLFILSQDMVEAYDKGYMILGNGPIMGVIKPPTDRPQIGIIKLDSTGYGNNCVSQNSAYSSPVTLNMVQANLTSANGGQTTAYQPQVVSLNLASDTGCVAFTGGISEQRTSGQIQVIPNPSGGVFRIEMDEKTGNAIRSVEIFNELGELVFKVAGPFNPAENIKPGDLPSGLYEIRILTESKVCRGKAVIIH
ncbi:MAG: hypothetical protein WCO02_06560 [Bacteroidota bacterium]